MSETAELTETEVTLPLADMLPCPSPLRIVNSEPWLAVSRCTNCDRDYLPARPQCLGCGSSEFVEALLPGTGILYSWSTIHLSANREVPYTIGYVDLEPGLRVLATIVGQIEGLACDMPVKLLPDPALLIFAAQGDVA